VHTDKANLPLTQAFVNAEITHQNFGVTGRHFLLASLQVSYKEGHTYPNGGNHTLFILISLHILPHNKAYHAREKGWE